MVRANLWHAYSNNQIFINWTYKLEAESILNTANTSNPTIRHPVGRDAGSISSSDLITSHRLDRFIILIKSQLIPI
jgi:hypothetical protein